jgi:hypothetical protein
MTASLRLLVVAAKVDGDAATGGPSSLFGVASRVTSVRLPSWTTEEEDRLAYEQGD